MSELNPNETVHLVEYPAVFYEEVKKWIDDHAENRVFVHRQKPKLEPGVRSIVMVKAICRSESDAIMLKLFVESLYAKD